MGTGYEPLNTLKPIGPDIWIVDGPVIKFYGMPFPTRMTVIRLHGGGLFIHSPIALDDGLLAELDGLGPVQHLVSPNWIHYASIGYWAKVYPKAVTWASPNVRARALKYQVDVCFDRDLGEEAAPEWAAEIKQMIVHGNAFHEEVVFFHDASNTLVLTDLIENFEAAKAPLWFRPIVWLISALDPDGGMPRDMRATFRKGRKELKQAVETMICWGPDKVVLSHGRWFESNGVQHLKRVLGWALK